MTRTEFQQNPYAGNEANVGANGSTDDVVGLSGNSYVNFSPTDSNLLLIEQQDDPEQILIFVVTAPVSVNYEGASVLDVRHVFILELIFDLTSYCTARYNGVDELKLVEYTIGQGLMEDAPVFNQPILDVTCPWNLISELETATQILPSQETIQLTRDELELTGITIDDLTKSVQVNITKYDMKDSEITLYFKRHAAEWPDVNFSTTISIRISDAGCNITYEGM